MNYTGIILWCRIKDMGQSLLIKTYCISTGYVKVRVGKGIVDFHSFLVWFGLVWFGGPNHRTKYNGQGVDFATF